MDSSNFESKIARSIEEGIVAGAACVAGRKDGTIFYNRAFGKAGAEPDAGSMKLDTVTWVASCTKLLTAISALQCVEKGLLKLDAPIKEVLTDLNTLDVLEGFDPETGKPILRKASKEITLRQLLTHTSGFAYIGMNAALTKYSMDVLGMPVAFSLDAPKDSCEGPLVFEPGESWAYGVSIEYAGRLVERVSGVRLGEYMQANIFNVLGMPFTTFHPWDHPEILARIGGRSWRDHETGKITVDQSGWFPFERPNADYGGGGLWTCAQDYIKVLVSLLLNDSKLLRPETVDSLFTPQLKEPNLSALRKELSTGIISAAVTNGLPRDSEFNHGLGAALCMKEIPGHCSSGMLFWSGLPNSFWFIDRNAGTCGIYLSHMLPPGDAPSLELNAHFQRYIYSTAKKG